MKIVDPARPRARWAVPLVLTVLAGGLAAEPAHVRAGAAEDRFDIVTIDGGIAESRQIAPALDRFLWVSGDAAVVRFDTETGKVVSGFNTPLGGPDDIVAVGQDVWAVFSGLGTIDRLTADGNVLEYKVKGRPTAIAFDGTYVWVALYETGRVIRFSPTAVGFDSVGVTVGGHPSSLLWQGNRMWIGSAGDPIRYIRTDLKALIPLSIPATGGDLGLAWDGAHLWAASLTNTVADEAVTKIDPATGDVLFATTMSNVTNIDAGGGYVYVLEHHLDVLGVDATEVFRIRTSNNDVLPFDSSPSGAAERLQPGLAVAFGFVWTTGDRVVPVESRVDQVVRSVP